MRIVFAFLITVPLLAGDRATRGIEGVQEMLEDAEIRRGLADLVILAAGMKACEGEHAAFLVRRADGKLALIPWNTDCASLRKTYRGVVPPNVLAIVHTHPEGRREPSGQDLLEAKRLQLPICVLTRRGVWFANPVTRTAIALLDDPRWTLTSTLSAAGAP